MTSIDPITAPSFGVPINEGKAVNNEYLEFFARMADNFIPAPILGQSGNPEGVTPGLIGQTYIDNSNNDMYIKRTGNDATGWIGPYKIT